MSSIPEDLPDGLVYEEAVDNSSNLFAAIKQGDITKFSELLSPYQLNEAESNANVVRAPMNVNNLLGMWSSTPLIVATQYSQKEIASILLGMKHVGDLNHRNEKGASVLLYACMEGLTEIVSTTY